MLQATPTTFEMLLAAGWEGSASVDLLIGGEAFRHSLLPLVAKCKSVRNVYGPTETTIWSSSFLFPVDFVSRITPSSTPQSAVNIHIPIGRPISQTQFFVASEQLVLELVEEGEEGELVIGGVGVAQGYLYSPELTKEKFIKNPLSMGNNVYRTGDIVKRLVDGNFLFVRRIDDQVKIDGFRIELAEIEVVFSRHYLIDQAVAIVRGGRIGIYLKAVAGQKLGPKEQESIVEQASGSLPHYMIPKYITVLDSFPKTANGKLDKRALPDPHRTAPMPFSPPPAEVSSMSPLIRNSPIFHTDVSYSGGAVGGHSSRKKTDCLFFMEDHIISIAFLVRGESFSPNDSFSSIGMDSLNSVIFLARRWRSTAMRS